VDAAWVFCFVCFVRFLFALCSLFVHLFTCLFVCSRVCSFVRDVSSHTGRGCWGNLKPACSLVPRGLTAGHAAGVGGWKASGKDEQTRQDQAGAGGGGSAAERKREGASGAEEQAGETHLDQTGTCCENAAEG